MNPLHRELAELLGAVLGRRWFERRQKAAPQSFRPDIRRLKGRKRPRERAEGKAVVEAPRETSAQPPDALKGEN